MTLLLVKIIKVPSKWNELFEWLPVETMIYYNQEKYYEVLLQSQQKGGTVDCRPFIDFMLDAIENAMYQYIDSEENKNGGINSGLFGGLNETEREIISLINENQHIKVFEMAQILSKPVRTIENNISQLKEKGIISRIGSKKTGHWKMN